MEVLLIIILLLVVIGCIITVFYAITYNKFQDYIIRINETENIIDKNLRNKYDLFNKIIPIIKNDLPDEKDIFKDLIKLRCRKLGNFDLYRTLINADNEFNSISDKYKKIENNCDIKKIIKNMKDIDSNLNNEIDYYNENISTYNNLLKKFPSNIVASFCKYKEKLYFDRKDMSDEDYDDFKL